jgi:hypothetical protein
MLDRVRTQTLFPLGDVPDDAEPGRFSASRDLLWKLGTSLALIIPCFWLERIQAGDLSSHLYNAWLAIQIKHGAVTGVAVVTTWTNVLSDWILEALFRLAGPMWAERVTVTLAVLLFFWGAFFLIYAATGHRPWLLVPCLAMLTYGLVFHLGFLNYYVSTGFCLWILALLWNPTRRRCLVAASLAVVALLAHALPLVWAISILGFLYVARRIPSKRRALLVLGGIAMLLVIQTLLVSRFPHRWSLADLATLSGVAGVTGVEQVWLYGTKYLIVSAGLLVVWCRLLLDRLERGPMLSDPVVELWILHMVAFALLPSAIQFPQYQHVLAYIPQRVSCLSAIFLCMVVGGSRQSRWTQRLLALVATTFFTFLYMDDRAFNMAENEVTDLLVDLPPGQRVVASITDADSRVNGLAHVADRACIGHCFSYANYEAATAQFRLRPVGPNPVVADTMQTVQDIEEGHHIVTAQEAPMYSVCPCEHSANRFCLRALRAGERTCSLSLEVSPKLWDKKLWDQ